MNLCQKVIFIGKVSDTTHVLEMSDLFLLPSETESFGLAALEALAVGVPVISSNTGGIPEVNLQDITGYLSDVGNINEMAENCVKLLLDESKFQKFRLNAIQRAKAFNLEKVLPMYEEIYYSLVNN